MITFSSNMSNSSLSKNSPVWSSDDEAQFPSMQLSPVEKDEEIPLTRWSIEGEEYTEEEEEVVTTGTDENDSDRSPEPTYVEEDIPESNIDVKPVKKYVEKPPEKPYTGLPESMTRRKFRPDYPEDLHYRKVCTANTKKLRRTLGNYKTQPAMVFSPVDSKMEVPEKDPNDGKPGQLKKKSIYGANYGVNGNPCHARQVPPVVSLADEEILEYLEKFNIQLMFEYFLSMSVFEAPENPYDFIAELAAKLAAARNNCEEFRKIPKLIHKKHLEALYRLYDKVGTGTISYGQYQSAMENLGLVEYTDEPEGYDEDKIKKATFIKEAKAALKDLIRSFQMNEEMLTGQTGDRVREAREKAKIACLQGKE